MKKSLLGLSIALACSTATPAFAHAEPTLAAGAYPGTLTLHVDATDLAHRVLKVREQIPVSPGALRL